MLILDLILILLGLITVLEEYHAYNEIKSIRVGKVVMYVFLAAQLIVFIIAMVGAILTLIVCFRNCNQK